MRALTILGASGFAQQVAWVVRRQGALDVVAFLDETIAEPTEVDAVPVLTTTADVVSQHAESQVISAVGSTALRRRWADTFAATHEFATVVDPSAALAESASVGRGCVLMPGAVCSPRVQVGQHTLLGFHTCLSHDTHVGDFTHLASGVIVSGRVRIGHGCRIGAGAIVLPDVVVGDGAIVGAGAVVTKNIPDGETVAGVPARALKKQNEGEPSPS